MVLAASQHRLVDICIAGDVDGDAEPVLGDAVARVAVIAPQHVFVDLTEVGFAGAALANFLAGLVEVLPHALPVTVCRPGPMHRWLLEVTGVAKILMISSGPTGRTPANEDGSGGPW
jgi:anti-anti-sigma regulatory factor